MWVRYHSTRHNISQLARLLSIPNSENAISEVISRTDAFRTQQPPPLPTKSKFPTPLRTAHSPHGFVQCASSHNIPGHPYFFQNGDIKVLHPGRVILQLVVGALLLLYLSS